MNVINKIKYMGHIPKENRTYDEFIKNVESHHKYEILAQEKLSSFFKTSLKSYNNTKDYDILLENNLKFEVKFIGTFDEYDTVNIECFRNNKPSGISTTQSDYYIVTNGDIYYLIKTDELLKISLISEIKKLKYSFCYIIPKTLFIASSLVI
jgi:hypothetical protein